MEEVIELGIKAKAAALKLATVSTKVKDRALMAMVDALVEREAAILSANEEDVNAAREQNISDALLDRLMLDSERVAEMASALREVSALRDPVGEVVAGWKRPNELQITKVRVPLGVIGMIYEARPNVTVDAAGLCLKTGNAVILRGGSIAIRSNLALTEVISDAASAAGIPENAIQSIANTSREAVLALMKMNDYVDVLIPRGGADLIQTVIQNSTVPVIETGVGNCHIYIDKAADLRMALAILINAKCQRPGVCNAAETMLVHEEIARKFLPKAIEELQAAGVTIFGCPVTLSIYPGIEIATEQDWRTEYLDLKIACKVVTSLEEAIDHINQYGSKHSEAIVTEDYPAVCRFVDEVDAAAVYANASTRFTDGGQFGLGAEIGISTQKLHARGPMALEALTSTKWVIYGNGQIRE